MKTAPVKSASKLKTHLSPGGMTMEESSGNVFADLGLPSPEEHLLKAELSLQIRRLIEAKGLTQTAAAKLVGLSQPKVNDILRGRLAGYSVERLLSVINKLGRNVEVRISKREYSGGAARTIVKTA